MMGDPFEIHVSEPKNKKTESNALYVHTYLSIKADSDSIT